MLARNFKTAEELGISEAVYNGTIMVLGMMERGELRHVPDLESREYDPDKAELGGFNMGVWTCRYDCGTVCCIGGTIQLLCKLDPEEDDDPGLNALFYPPEHYNYDRITIDQAAQATRNYLTTGMANWDSILAENT